MHFFSLSNFDFPMSSMCHMDFLSTTIRYQVYNQAFHEARSVITEVTWCECTHMSPIIFLDNYTNPPIPVVRLSTTVRLIWYPHDDKLCKHLLPIIRFMNSNPLPARHGVDSRWSEMTLPANSLTAASNFPLH